MDVALHMYLHIYKLPFLRETGICLKQFSTWCRMLDIKKLNQY